MSDALQGHHQSGFWMSYPGELQINSIDDNKQLGREKMEEEMMAQ